MRPPACAIGSRRIAEDPYDAADDTLDAHLVIAAARQIKVL
jgi:hypothetical protein